MINSKTSGDGGDIEGVCAHCKRKVSDCNFTCSGALAYKENNKDN